MAFFLTLFYILTAYLTPETIFGALADYHVEVVVAIFTLICSLFASDKPPLMRMPQVHVLFGMMAAVFLSIATSGWIGGAQSALLVFFPNVFVFFFIVINCRTKRHIQMVVLVLLFACCFVIFKGAMALWSGDTTSAYLLPMHDNEGDTFYRLNGLGFINDPNDFGQVLVSLMPCLFLFWRPKRSFLNTICVLIPASFLIFGMYLTHSRGAMLALLVVVVVAARRKIGTVPSIVIASCLFAVTMAVGWAGNRDVSVEAGADRMDAWAAGLDMIKQHPIFGVGFNGYTDHYPLTAHNTIVVCAAETGMVGFFSWILFVYSTFWEAITTGGTPVDKKKEKKKEEAALSYIGMPMTRLGFAGGMQKASTAVLAGSSVAMSSAATLYHGGAALPHLTLSQEETDLIATEDIRRYGRIMVISLSGFLVAGWFLSRAFEMSLFVYCGIVEVIYQMALAKGLVPEQMPRKKLLRVSLLIAVCLLTVVYLMLRVEHSMGIH